MRVTNLVGEYVLCKMKTETMSIFLGLTILSTVSSPQAPTLLTVVLKEHPHDLTLLCSKGIFHNE